MSEKAIVCGEARERKLQAFGVVTEEPEGEQGMAPAASAGGRPLCHIFVNKQRRERPTALDGPLTKSPASQAVRKRTGTKGKAGSCDDRV